MTTIRRAIIILACFISLLPLHAQRLSQLVNTVPWERLEAYQGTITREEFQRLLDTVYAPGGAAAGVIEVRENEALIKKTLTPPELFTLHFVKDPKSAKKPVEYWHLPRKTSAKHPLKGVTIALDPGHIGGNWALMEERSFARPGDKPVQEGDMTLRVAKLIAPKLKALGADVQFARSRNEPLSPVTVEGFFPDARKELELLGIHDFRERYDGPHDPRKAQTVQFQAEKLLYRVAEIRERATRVNKRLQPDLVICLHFNADDWRDPEAPVFTPRNDLHVLVHGCYSAGELRYDDERYDMLLKLLNRSHNPELAAAIPISNALRKATGLPPFEYITDNAIKATPDGYIWSRNLLANRLFECPTVFLEPYRMNNEETYARIQAGDYEGEREVAGKMRKSIFREYADAVVEGVLAYYQRPGDVKPR